MKARVFICIPVHREMCYEARTYLNANIDAAQNWELAGIEFLYEESLIPRARNTLHASFLKSKATHLFFMDDDIILINKDAVDSLVDLKADIAGAPYIFKKPPHLPTFKPLYGNILPDLKTIKEPFEVRWQGTGCMLIARATAEAIAAKFKYPFELFEVDGEYLSEDWAYCQRARKLGFKVILDPKIEVGHMGKYCYSVNDFYNFNQGG